VLKLLIGLSGLSFLPFAPALGRSPRSASASHYGFGVFFRGDIGCPPTSLLNGVGLPPEHNHQSLLNCDILNRAGRDSSAGPGLKDFSIFRFFFSQRFLVPLPKSSVRDTQRSSPPLFFLSHCATAAWPFFFSFDAVTSYHSSSFMS